MRKHNAPGLSAVLMGSAACRKIHQWYRYSKVKEDVPDDWKYNG